MSSTIAALRMQFGRMQMEIDATLAMLEGMQDDTVIIDGPIARCAPIVIDPPRFDQDCEHQIPIQDGPITVQQAETAIAMLSKWMHNMMRVLEEADPTLPLP